MHAGDDAEGRDEDVAGEERLQVHESVGEGRGVEDLETVLAKFLRSGCGMVGQGEGFTCGVTRKDPKWMGLGIGGGILEGIVVSGEELSCI